MIVFLYKAVFNWGKENWCPLDLREYLEYGRRQLGRRGLRRWWLSWISLELFAELITKRVKRVEGDKCPVSASACMYVLVVFPVHSVPVGVINRRKNAACLPVLQWLLHFRCKSVLGRFWYQLYICETTSWNMTTVLSFVYYSAADRGAEYCGERFCLSVCACLFVRDRIFGTHVRSSPNFLYLLPMAVDRSFSGAVTLMYFRYYGWRHICL